jgi:hypothetical protein
MKCPSLEKAATVPPFQNLQGRTFGNRSAIDSDLTFENCPAIGAEFSFGSSFENSGSTRSGLKQFPVRHL